MNTEIVELSEDMSQSSLYSQDLAPVPGDKRSWNMWSLAAIWVGMAVCIPTYLLASDMIKNGLGWVESLWIIFLANLIVTIPMIFNGHAGVKYGIPFPVVGRAAFGVFGVHIPSIVRGIVACGWFGIQTWIGGLAFYAIWCVLTGQEMVGGLTLTKFVCFFLFWCLNIFVIWKGTESIRWLESFSAPILILIGIVLIGWGAVKGGGFGTVLAQSQQLGRATVTLDPAAGYALRMEPVRDAEGRLKARDFRLRLNSPDAPPLVTDWRNLGKTALSLTATYPTMDWAASTGVEVQFRGTRETLSSWIGAQPVAAPITAAGKWSLYIKWLTIMVGFWATMSISISDITRYTSSQKEQALGQLIGLPGTMLLYSFVGVFVTCASLLLFNDVLISEDAPWDPVTLLSKFQNPTVVIVSQIFMLIATLSTNIAANVIAPANAFANAFPKSISFRAGGVITGVIGIAICPWWLMSEISRILLFVSGLLGPVLGVLLSDYFYVRKRRLNLAELYRPGGIYHFGNGFNNAALIALAGGVLVALIGFWVPALEWLYSLSWFSGFLVAFALYALLMKSPQTSEQAPA